MKEHEEIRARFLALCAGLTSLSDKDLASLHSSAYQEMIRRRKEKISRGDFPDMNEEEKGMVRAKGVIDTLLCYIHDTTIIGERYVKPIT